MDFLDAPGYLTRYRILRRKASIAIQRYFSTNISTLSESSSSPLNHVNEKEDITVDEMMDHIMSERNEDTVRWMTTAERMAPFILALYAMRENEGERIDEIIMDCMSMYGDLRQDIVQNRVGNVLRRLSMFSQLSLLEFVPLFTSFMMTMSVR